MLLDRLHRLFTDAARFESCFALAFNQIPHFETINALVRLGNRLAGEAVGRDGEQTEIGKIVGTQIVLHIDTAEGVGRIAGTGMVDFGDFDSAGKVRVLFGDGSRNVCR